MRTTPGWIQWGKGYREVEVWGRYKLPKGRRAVKYRFLDSSEVYIDDASRVLSENPNETPPST